MGTHIIHYFGIENVQSEQMMAGITENDNLYAER